MIIYWVTVKADGDGSSVYFLAMEKAPPKIVEGELFVLPHMMLGGKKMKAYIVPRISSSEKFGEWVLRHRWSYQELRHIDLKAAKVITEWADGDDAEIIRAVEGGEV